MVDTKIKIMQVSWACLAVAMLLLNCSCTPTKEQQQARFQYDVNGAVGLPLERLQMSDNSFIGSRKPTSVSRLSDGNTLYVYRDYWGSYQIKRENCDVFLEVNNAGIVAASHAEGPGCYMNY